MSLLGYAKINLKEIHEMAPTSTLHYAVVAHTVLERVPMENQLGSLVVMDTEIPWFNGIMQWVVVNVITP